MAKVYVVLDNIRSAYNVGAFFRTADALKPIVEEIVCVNITPTPDNPKVVKTALGAEGSIKWGYKYSIRETIDYLKKKKIPLYTIETPAYGNKEGNIRYDLFVPPPKVALVFGNEVRGTNQLFINESLGRLYIPMLGLKGSLNVASCAAVILFELGRKYNIWK